jgi:hypothetical protein
MNDRLKFFAAGFPTNEQRGRKNGFAAGKNLLKWNNITPIAAMPRTPSRQGKRVAELI